MCDEKRETLHLVLKFKWYDMIIADLKGEEYREIKPTWTKRIWNRRGEIKRVCLHRGYTSITHTRDVTDITKSAGRHELGAVPGKTYYVIKLGKEAKP